MRKSMAYRLRCEGRQAPTPTRPCFSHEWPILPALFLALERSTCAQRIMNLNNQNALYKHGMTPVFRLSGNPNWARLKQKVTFEVNTSLTVPLKCMLDGIVHPASDSERSVPHSFVNRS